MQREFGSFRENFTWIEFSQRYLYLHTFISIFYLIWPIYKIFIYNLGLLLNELHMAINYVTQLDTDPDYGPSNAQKDEIMKAYKYLGKIFLEL